jgi:branched-chain amino acid transport system substrate-binding protein
MLKTAIENAGTTESAQVRDALEAIDINLVTGHVVFDEKHNPVKSAVMLELVQDNGHIHPVYNATVDVD